ncbi:MAG: CarD family transcriptional regulator [Firmicutes bacterium]|nr:CarD family transcriptional regulator [Bacillota bacterium]
MFKKGDYIIYGNSGVCQVEDITIPDFMGDGTIEYYVLVPIRDTGRIYIPVNTNKFMRPVITKKQAMELIAQIPSIQKAEYQVRDHRMLSEQYKHSLDSHELSDLVQLIKTIYLKNEDLATRGKRPSNTDMQYMKKAEDLLHSELSIALGIPFHEVASFITTEIEKMK